ncbi:MAG: ATP-binding protein [Burkholderiales bacterium]|nr:ATP-binding protein [Burkholderiales bacterium]
MESQLREIVRQKIVDALAAPPPAFTRRNVRLPAVPRKALAVIGMRRAGKTTLLWQLLADRLARGTGRQGLLYFSFEDERLAGMTARDLNLVVEEYYRLNPEWRDRRRASFFLDEIQVVPGWESFARRLLDSEQIDLFLSGSSARLLSREVASSMRGRGVEAVVYPFSFREHLRHHRREPGEAAGRLTKAQRSALEKDLWGYLAAGGFPEAQGLKPRDRYELLRGDVDVALLRDVVERHAVSHPVALRWMVRQLLGNAAGSFSVNRFHGDLKSQGIAVAKDTLHSYLGYLEDAFLVRMVSIAADSERRRMVNPRKVYPIDPGLIPLFDRAAKANLGHALETCVLLELDRRGAETGYVRTAHGHEVDFLARYPAGKEELIQVCASLDDPATRERETRALLEAARQYPRAGLHLVSLDIPAAHDIPAKITVHAACDWLLQGNSRA